MSQSKPTKTIDQVFREFLAEQEARLGPATVSKYESILDLLGSCLERYWPGHEQSEYERITAAGGTFCGTLGPEEVLAGLSEFLGYFMPGPHSVLWNRRTASQSVARPIAASASRCGQRYARPTPFRKIVRTTTRK